jgi:hypothetical protein
MAVPDWFYQHMAQLRRENGILPERAKSIVRFLEQRGIELSEAERERILSCDDDGQLELWMCDSHTASSAEEFFAAETAEQLRAKGRAEARAEVLVEDILLALGVRGVEFSEADRERITSCTDHDELRTWLRRACTASSAAELFAG